MADGANGAIGRNARTPAKVPKETGVRAANGNAIDRNQRTEVNDVWATVTK